MKALQGDCMSSAKSIVGIWEAAGSRHFLGPEGMELTCDPLILVLTSML